MDAKTNRIITQLGYSLRPTELADTSELQSLIRDGLVQEQYGLYFLSADGWKLFERNEAALLMDDDSWQNEGEWNLSG